MSLCKRWPVLLWAMLCLLLSGCLHGEAPTTVTPVEKVSDGTSKVQSFTSSSDETPDETPEKQEVSKPTRSGKIWICKSSGAKRYHYNQDCGGLGKCKHEVVRQTVAEAEAVGLTACSYKKCHQ